MYAVSFNAWWDKVIPNVRCKRRTLTVRYVLAKYNISLMFVNEYILPTDNELINM